ncbi:MAG: hemin ABC transporter substrate-binding protein [Rhodospirillales bacterium]|nr:MAG: hemin ABC transporter substrate-binding protein [Rhodospirillales bacterium]
MAGPRRKSGQGGCLMAGRWLPGCRTARAAAVGLAAMLIASGDVDAGDGPENGVVSVGGAVTEIVFALGAEDRLVAVDSTSQHPEAVRHLPNVGYLRQLAAEPILALNPSLVLALSDAGPPHALDLIRQAGVPVLTVPHEPTPAGVVRKVAIVAEALDRAHAGKSLAERITADLERLSAAVNRRSETPSVLFMFSAGGGAPLVAGNDTSAAAIIALAGGRNAVTGYDGFKPLNPEAAIAAAPDVILVTTGTLEALGGAEVVLSLPYLAPSPAAAAGHLIAMDALLLLGFGPRIGEAVHTLASRLHPDLVLPPTAVRASR